MDGGFGKVTLSGRTQRLCIQEGPGRVGKHPAVQVTAYQSDEAE